MKIGDTLRFVWCGSLGPCPGLNYRPELGSALELAKSLPAERLPELLGDLAEIGATATARLNAPAPEIPEDKLLDVTETSLRLGVSKSFVYRRGKMFPFVVRMGRSLRFSSAGIEKYLRAKNGLTPRRLAK